MVGHKTLREWEDKKSPAHAPGFLVPLTCGDSASCEGGLYFV
jgi:hypothetical protein